MKWAVIIKLELYIPKMFDRYIKEGNDYFNYMFQNIEPVTATFLAITKLFPTEAERLEKVTPHTKGNLFAWLIHRIKV